MSTEKSILIIGRPESGKTRFLSQFCIRAEKKKSAISFFDRPGELSHITEDRKLVAQGLSSKRTATDANLNVDLSIEYDGQQHTVSYPDSAGEHINSMVKERKINPHWQKLIKASNEWILFIRTTNLKKQFDPTLKPNKNNQKSASQNEEIIISDQGFFIELIQLLLYIKEVGIRDSSNLPKLSVVLTCWDELKPKKHQEMNPKDVLCEEKVLPLFNQFIHSIWDSHKLKIYGLSAQGQSLSKDEIDDDYIDEGPENKGYLILPNGEKCKDITRLIADLL